MSDTSSARPKNVVVLDAENPLVEIHGEFFWREDHERLLAAAREQAFRDGFAQGCASQPPLRQRPIVVRTRVRKHRLTRLVIALLLLSFVLSVILTVVQAALRLQ